MSPQLGDRVRWTFIEIRRGKDVHEIIEGTVVDRPTKFGRIAVLSDDGTENHIQPDWVEVVE